MPNTVSCIASKGLADGCSINGASPIPPDVIAPSHIAAVRCCSYDGKDCISPEPCLETTYDEARKKCATIGRRLCTAAEMDICCWKGCYFDDKLNWYINFTGWFYTCRFAANFLCCGNRQNDTLLPRQKRQNLFWAFSRYKMYLFIKFF